MVGQALQAAAGKAGEEEEEKEEAAASLWLPCSRSSVLLAAPLLAPAAGQSRSSSNLQSASLCQSSRVRPLPPVLQLQERIMQQRGAGRRRAAGRQLQQQLQQQQMPLMWTLRLQSPRQQRCQMAVSSSSLCAL